MSERDLVIEDLHVEVAGKEILRGLDLTVTRGHVHALMGPNGSGKSTLAQTIMGHPSYTVTQGRILFKGQNLLDLSPDKRARLGLFLAFQYPSAIPGVSVANFLRLALNSRRAETGDKPISPREFRELLKDKLHLLKVDQSFINRYLNEGFSGGEKKRAEILQMAVLAPEMAVLDETDSGLDIDALKTVAGGVEKQRGPDLGVLIITHYTRVLRYIKPDFVHVMLQGKIVTSGGGSLADELESKGYDWVRREFGAAAGLSDEEMATATGPVSERES
jgi:Fe-S cluster assembly ATP-binding protein